MGSKKFAMSVAKNYLFGKKFELSISHDTKESPSKVLLNGKLQNQNIKFCKNCALYYYANCSKKH